MKLSQLLLSLALIISPAELALAEKQNSSESFPSQDSNLFIFREYAEPTLIAAKISVDGRVLTKLGNKSYTATTISPGPTVVQSHWPGTDEKQDPIAFLMIEEGKRYYLRVAGSVTSTGSKIATLKLHQQSDLEIVDPEQGRQMIAACCKFKPSQ